MVIPDLNVINYGRAADSEAGDAEDDTLKGKIKAATSSVNFVVREI